MAVAAMGAFQGAADEVSNDQDFGAKAGIVVSIKEDFLARGQNELLSEFVSRINMAGEETVHVIDMEKYLDKREATGLKVAISNLKILDTGSLTSTATKTIDVQAECRCIKGSIGSVDKMVMAFDYEFASSLDFDSISGNASVTFYGFSIDYTVKPTVVNIDEAFSFHEQGMLYLQLDEFQARADDFPIVI